MQRMVSGGVWRLCDSERGRGTCIDFQPGQYDSLGALNGRVRSAYLVTPVQERVATVAVVAAGTRRGLRVSELRRSSAGD